MSAPPERTVELVSQLLRTRLGPIKQNDGGVRERQDDGGVRERQDDGGETE